MVCGGSQVIRPLSLIEFGLLKALSTRNHSPEMASRPFDLERDGFVLSEGAGIILLEELDRAVRRGASIYAELIGYGASCDAYRITDPSPDGEGAARAIELALRDAGLSPPEVNYVNAHGTATLEGDRAETLAIKRVFGSHAYRVPVSSTKSMIGHLVLAAGAVELIATVLALRHGILPPTINLETPDPQCDLDYVPHRAREGRIETALSNSFGFGGQNVVLAARRWNGSP
jgi:3-oxoacyl-[acyl-carrier-protein] synthase II